MGTDDMTEKGVPLSLEALGKMVAEVGADSGPGSVGWNGPGSDTQHVNAAVIAALRANQGELSAELTAATGPLLILTTIGAKTGARRTIPLGYLEVDGRLLVVGSMAGSVRNPPWYYNIVANPQVEVELAGEVFEAQARVLGGADRTQIFPKVCDKNPAYATIQDSVERLIPVIELIRG